MLEEALEYAERGWPVFPLRPGAKTPATTNGFKDATTDPEKIRSWWEEGPAYNIGIATGKASFTAIDPDGPHAAGLLKTLPTPPPNACIVKTPNGHHTYIQYDEGFKQTARLMQADCDCEKKCGVDVRNDGGYVVAPPSIVNDKPYKFLKDETLEPWPEGLQIKRPARASLKDDWSEKPSWVSTLLVSGAPEGQRNDAAARLAGYFRSIDVPFDIALASMKQFADACKPPMDYAELEAAAKSAWRYQPTKTFSYQGVELPAPIEDVSVGTRRVYRWPDDNLFVLVDRLNETRRGIDCELTVQVNGATLYGPIHFDLMSETKRTSLARSLKDRKEHNWSAVIQHVAFLVRKSLREIEQIVDLTTHQIAPSAGWHIEPFLRVNTPMLLYGHGGVGKSILALAIAISVAIGRSIIPGAVVHKQCNVLVLDIESDEDDHAQTLRDLANGNDVELPAGSLFYWRIKPPLLQNIDWLVERCAELNIGLVLIDSVVGAGMPADPFSPESAMNYKMAHQLLGVSVIGISHLSAEELKKRSPRPYGSVYFWDWSRACWLVKGKQEANSPINQMALTNEKANRGKQESLVFDVEFSEGTIRYKRGDKFTSPVADAAIDAWEAIHHLLLKTGAMYRKEVYEELAGDTYSESALKKAIQRGMGKHFTETPDGRVGAMSPVQNSPSGDMSPTVPNNVPSDWGTGDRDTRGVYRPPVSPPGPSVPSQKTEYRKPYKDEEDEDDGTF